jgi:hypothetical protein
MDLVALHYGATEAFGARVEAVREEQWSLPTPCTDWNVRDLVNHLVYENRWTDPILAGKTIEEVGDRFEGDLLGDDPVAAWRDAVAEARAAVAAPGALGRAVHLSFGDAPAELYVHQLFADHLPELFIIISVPEMIQELFYLVRGAPVFQVSLKQTVEIVVFQDGVFVYLSGCSDRYTNGKGAISALVRNFLFFVCPKGIRQPADD